MTNLWYNDITLPVITPPITIARCSRCHSALIVVKVETERIENHRFPVTITTYNCSNKACQIETDKKTALRLKHRAEQELAKQEREKIRVKNIVLKKKTN